MSYRPSRTPANYADIADEDRQSYRDRGGQDSRRDDRGGDSGWGRGGRGGERNYGGGAGGGRDSYRDHDRGDRGDRKDQGYRGGERDGRDGRGGDPHRERPGERRRSSRSRSPRRRDDRERERDREDRDRRRGDREAPSHRERERETVPSRPGQSPVVERGSPNVEEVRGGWAGERSVPAPREDRHVDMRRDRSVSEARSLVDEAAENDAAAMAAMMGFSGFDTTKDKHVQDDLAAVAIKQPRTHRQYMNRPGGFNRPLDKIK